MAFPPSNPIPTCYAGYNYAQKGESHNLLPRMHLCYIDKLFREIALHAIFGLSSAAYVHTQRPNEEGGGTRNYDYYVMLEY